MSATSRAEDGELDPLLAATDAFKHCSALPNVACGARPRCLTIAVPRLVASPPMSNARTPWWGCQQAPGTTGAEGQASPRLAGVLQMQRSSVLATMPAHRCAQGQVLQQMCSKVLRQTILRWEVAKAQHLLCWIDRQLLLSHCLQYHALRLGSSCRTEGHACLEST